MHCRLCLNDGKLVKAHAIPEAFFRELREESRAPILISGSSSAFPKKAPIGVYDEGILCDQCEPKFGAVDDYGIQVLLKRLHELFIPVATGAGPVAFQASGVDQDLLLRFLVATLWRAAVSTQAFYRRVQLGPHEGVARHAILNPQSPLPSVFGAVLSRWTADEESQFTSGGLMDPFREKWDGVNAYRIYFGEVVAYVKVDSQLFRSPLREIALLAQESTTLVARSLGKSKDMAAMIRTAKESHKHDKRRREYRHARGR